MRAMFDRIAGFYDVMNSVMTAGLHHALAPPRRRPRRASAPATACSTSRPAPATSRSSSPRRVGPGGEVIGSDFSEEMLARARTKGAGRAGADHVRVGQRDGAALRRRRVRRRDGRLRRAQLLRPRPRPGRDGARRAPRRHASSCSRSRRRRGRRCRRFYRAVVRSRRAADRHASPATREAYSYLPNSVKRFPGPRELAARMDAAAWTCATSSRRAASSRCTSARGGRGDDRVAASVEAIVARGGSARAGAARARSSSASRRSRPATARCSPSTRARRSPPAASGCARCSSCSPPGRRRRTTRASSIAAAAAVELVHSATLVHDDVLDAASLRRGVPTVWAQGGRALAVATGDLLFSRAFAELAAAGSLAAVRALSRATSALAEGELLQREDAWNAGVAVERYLLPLRAEDRAPVRGVVRARRARGSAPGDEQVAGARRVRPRHRPRLPAARRRPRRRPAPASSTGKHRGTDLLDGTVTLPLILARERDPALAAIDLRAITTPEQRDGAVRAHRGDRRAGGGARRGRSRSSPRPRRRLAALALEDGQRVALDLVADSVVDRHA